MTELREMYSHIERECKYMAKDSMGGYSNTVFADRIIEDVIGINDFCTMVLSSRNSFAVINRYVQNSGHMILKFFNIHLHDSRCELVKVLEEASKIKKYCSKKSAAIAYNYLYRLYNASIAQMKMIVNGNKKKNQYEYIFSDLKRFSKNGFKNLMMEEVDGEFIYSPKTNLNDVDNQYDDSDDEDDDDEYDDEDSAIAELAEDVIAKRGGIVVQQFNNKEIESFDDFCQKEGITIIPETSESSVVAPSNEVLPKQSEKVIGVKEEMVNDPIVKHTTTMKTEIMPIPSSEKTTPPEPPKSKKEILGGNLSDVIRQMNAKTAGEEASSSTEEDTDSDDSQLPPDVMSGGNNIPSTESTEDNSVQTSTTNSSKKKTRKERKAEKRRKQLEKKAAQNNQQVEDHGDSIESLDRKDPHYIDNLMSGKYNPIDVINEIVSTPTNGKYLEVSFPPLPEGFGQHSNKPIEGEVLEIVPAEIDESVIIDDEDSDMDTNNNIIAFNKCLEEINDIQFNYLKSEYKKYFDSLDIKIVDLNVTITPSIKPDKLLTIRVDLRIDGNYEPIIMRRLYSKAHANTVSLSIDLNVDQSLFDVKLEVYTCEATYSSDLDEYLSDHFTDCDITSIDKRNRFASALALYLYRYRDITKLSTDLCISYIYITPFTDSVNGISTFNVYPLSKILTDEELENLHYVMKPIISNIGSLYVLPEKIFLFHNKDQSMIHANNLKVYDKLKTFIDFKSWFDEMKYFIENRITRIFNNETSLTYSYEFAMVNGINTLTINYDILMDHHPDEEMDELGEIKEDIYYTDQYRYQLYALLHMIDPIMNFIFTMSFKYKNNNSETENIEN